MQPQNRVPSPHPKPNQQNKKQLSVSGKELYLWRNRAKAEAIAKGIAVEEIDWLLLEVSDLDRLSLSLNSFQEREIALNVSLAELSQWWQQRIEINLPVQYLIGASYWRNYRLKVSAAVLIPRPETELIIDLAVKAAAASELSEKKTEHWLDLGTGSGAIAIGLANSFPQATIHAVDRSQEALAIARENALACSFNTRIKFYHGNWWEPLTALKGKVRGMVSNPPYIPTAQLNSLQLEVAKHEPHLALDGGADGLAAIRQLIEIAPDYLVSGGIWLVEMMAGQAPSIARLLEQQGNYCKVEILPDLAGIERFALAYRR